MIHTPTPQAACQYDFSFYPTYRAALKQFDKGDYKGYQLMEISSYGAIIGLIGLDNSITQLTKKKIKWGDIVASLFSVDYFDTAKVKIYKNELMKHGMIVK